MRICGTDPCVVVNFHEQSHKLLLQRYLGCEKTGLFNHDQHTYVSFVIFIGPHCDEMTQLNTFCTIYLKLYLRMFQKSSIFQEM